MSVRSQAIDGLKWTSLTRFIIVVGQVVKISVLARLLEKSDFGLVALIMFVLGFTGILIDMGFTTAILHKQNISKRQYSSIYWLNIGFSLIVYIAIYFSSSVIADYYSQPDLKTLLEIMGLSLIISAMGKQYRTIEQKNLNFKVLSLVDLAATTISVFVAVVLATLGYGVYSIVFAALAEYAVGSLFFLVFGMINHGFPRYFSFHETSEFIKIGLYQVGGDITNYLSRDTDLLIIGKVMGVEVLGGYNLARELVRRPLQLIDPIISKVSTPIFSQFQDHNEKLRTSFTLLLRNVTIINAIIYGSMAISAKSLILVFYGIDYLHIAVYLQLFAPIIYLRSAMAQSSVITIAKGRTDLGMYWSIVNIILSASIILALIKTRLEYIIGALALFHILLLIPSWYIFGRRLINFNFRNYISMILNPLLISILFFAIYYFLMQRYSFIGEFVAVCGLIIVLFMYGYSQSKEIQDIYNKFRHLFL
jgi:O-antigen/teichoic acid export membrane protein